MGGGLGEHKRDILKLREEVNGLTVKSASHEVDIQKNSDAVRKMEKQRNMDEQNWKAQMDALHDVLDTKVNEKPFEDLKHCVASLTKGTVKFAQVVGVFPGPRFDDAEGLDQSEADVELMGWEECAENMSFRVDKAWRQRCSQRFRNILDMIAKKADHSVLRLLQISQQHIESQLERVKHERELWKEVVERRQQQPLLCIVHEGVRRPRFFNTCTDTAMIQRGIRLIYKLTKDLFLVILLFFAV